MKAIAVSRLSGQQLVLSLRKFSDSGRYRLCRWLCDFSLWQAADSAALEATFDALAVESHYGLQLTVHPEQK